MAYKVVIVGEVVIGMTPYSTDNGAICTAILQGPLLDASGVH